MIIIISKIKPDSKWYFESFDQIGLLNNIGDQEKVSVLEWVLKYYYLYVDGVEYVC